MPLIAGVRACVFDAYGTLFDFASAAARCPGVRDSLRSALAALWREKQLQYSWLSALQGRQVDFWRVTGDALDYALESLGIAEPDLRDALMDLYLTLDAYPGVADVLARLRGAEFRLAILSNGTPGMLAAAVERSGVAGSLERILSADAVGVFKTHPKVYQYAVDELGLPPREIVFISSNGWDAYAASAFGFKVVWCNRYGARPERLPGAPDLVISSLADLPAALGAA